MDMKDDMVQVRDDTAGQAPLVPPIGIGQFHVDLKGLTGIEGTHSVLLTGPISDPDRDTEGNRGNAAQIEEPETFCSESSEEAEIFVTEQQEKIVTFSEEQLAAAKTIQLAYHHLLQRRKKGNESDLAVKRNRFFLECWNTSEKIQWQRRQYRHLFLGPLPHLLLCLEKANTHAFHMKKRIKKRINNVQHRELDEAWTKMTEVK